MADEFNSGQSGYLFAEVVVVVGGVYVGGGLTGWSGGTEYTFRFKMRKPGTERGRANTNDGPFGTGVATQTTINFDGSGFYKGEGYPPVELAQDEYVRVQCNTIFDFDMILLVEKFDPVGDAEGSVEWQLQGKSDGIYTVN